MKLEYTTVFQLQQAPLRFSAISKTREAAIGSHYAMAGYNKQQGVPVASHAYSAACSGIANLGGYLSVGASGAIRTLFSLFYLIAKIKRNKE